jgi:hypothetical protein
VTDEISRLSERERVYQNSVALCHITVSVHAVALTSDTDSDTDSVTLCSVGKPSNLTLTLRALKVVRGGGSNLRLRGGLEPVRGVITVRGGGFINYPLTKPSLSLSCKGVTLNSTGSTSLYHLIYATPVAPSSPFSPSSPSPLSHRSPPLPTKLSRALFHRRWRQAEDLVRDSAMPLAMFGHDSLTGSDAYSRGRVEDEVNRKAAQQTQSLSRCTVH